MTNWFGTKEFDEFRETVYAALRGKYGIDKVKDGFAGPISQTGEEYIEVVITGNTIANVGKMMAGAIASYGDSNSTLYWRIKPEYDGSRGNEKKGYARFLITNRKEFASSEEALEWWNQIGKFQDQTQHDD